MVLTIVICYIVCWTPYWCYQVFNYIYQHAFEYSQSHLLTIISHLVQTIAYMSSALNPIIYSYMSEAFRTSFQLVIESCNCCLPSKSHFYSNSDNEILNANVGHEALPLSNQNYFDEISRQSLPESVSDNNNR